MMRLLTRFMHKSASVPRLSLDTELNGARLCLHIGSPTDWKAWRALREASRDYLVPREPKWPDHALSYGYYCSLLRRQWREWRQGKSFAFSIFLKGETAEPVLVGGITLGDVIYAPVATGTLGYWLAQAYAGQGIMTEAVGLVCAFAFDTLHLHRVEAGCMLDNEASKTVLRRNGFVEQGIARAHLQINGTMEDHLLWRQEREI